MPNLNKVILIGHLTRDPETRAVGETSVTNFGIATNHKWQSKDGEKKEEVYFGECQCWGKRGEVIARFVKKGDALSLQGRLRLEQWEKDGAKQSKTRIVVEDFQLLGGKRDGGDEQAAPQAQPKARTTGANAKTRPAAATSALDDDDIPF